MVGLQRWIIVIVRPESPDEFVGKGYFPTQDFSQALVFSIQRQARQIATEVLRLVSSYTPAHALVVDVIAYSDLVCRAGGPLIGWESAEALVREEDGGSYSCVLVNPKLVPSGKALGCSQGSSSESRP